MGLGCCCSATPSSFVKSLGRSRSGRATVFSRARDHSDPVRIVAEGEFATWQAEMAKELATPILLNGALLARVTLLRKGNGSILLLSMHHSIADGLSAAFVVRDILEALSGKPLQPLTLTDPQENLSSAVAGTPPPPSVPVSPSATLQERCRRTSGPGFEAFQRIDDEIADTCS